MRPRPTTRQMIVLEALFRVLKEREGQSPSFRELAQKLDCRSVRTITEHVHVLRRFGFVAHLPNEARTLWITDLGEKALRAWTRPDHADGVRV